MSDKAEKSDKTEEGEGKKGGLLKPIILIAGGAVVGGGGFAIPLLAPQLFGAHEEVVEEVVEEPVVVEPAFIDFGETVVNLNSDRFNRYLRLSITLQVNLEETEEIEEVLAVKKAILKSWLLSHLSDKSMEEIRGAAGQNQMRREIQDHFNRVLFTDGYDRIHDVLFQEFSVQ